MKFAQFFTLMFAFLILNSATAGVLIEPAAGYSFIKSDDDKGNGGSLGGRLGYQNFGFQLGVDYLRSSISVDNKTYKDSLVINEYAGFIGYEFPVLLRVYAGYIFQASGSTKINKDFGAGTQDYKVDYAKGVGTKFGIGFTGLPFVDINIEYRKGSLKDGKAGTLDITDNLDYSAYMIGISLPFVL
jgi:hypothetical protein